MALAETYQGNHRGAAQRCRALKAGELRSNRGYGALERILRHRSRTGGAELAFGETSGIPSHFEIGADGTCLMTPVRRRTVSVLGVAF
jgi:hypothetical protein